MIALYKRIRATVQTGDLYRLFSPAHQRPHRQPVRVGGRQAGRGVRLPPLAAVQHRRAHDPPARPRRTRHSTSVESVDNKLVERQPQLSGAYLMRAGLNVNLRGDFDGTAIILDRQ